MKELKIIILFIIISMLFLSCKHNKKNKNNSVVVQLEDIKKINNNNQKKWYKKIDLKCDQKEEPKKCITKDIKILFDFQQEPNIIKIERRKKTGEYKLKNFFEGIGYSPLLFELDNKRIILVELIYEYGSKFLAFYSDEELYYIGSFNQDDIFDDSGGYIEFKPIVFSEKEVIHVKIGNKFFFNEHSLELKNMTKLVNTK